MQWATSNKRYDRTLSLVPADSSRAEEVLNIAFSLKLIVLPLIIVFGLGGHYIQNFASIENNMNGITLSLLKLITLKHPLNLLFISKRQILNFGLYLG